MSVEISQHNLIPQTAVGVATKTLSTIDTYCFRFVKIYMCAYGSPKP